MKILFYILIALVLIICILLALSFYSSKQNASIEQYKYEVIDTYRDVEIRQYEASLFTSVKIPSNEYSKASSDGFRVLAGYIFGANDKNEKIAMTSPVTMTLEDSTEMMFMVPKSYSKDELPQPNDKNIRFVQVPAKRMAAIRFGGWSNDDKIDSYKVKLRQTLDQEDISYTDNYYYYGYNPPYEVFNRRNEVLVELE